MPKIFDTFMFFNELDLLEIRLNILEPYVDYFVISESTLTFSGKEKPLYYLENKERFNRFEPKIIHNIVSDTPKEFSNWRPPTNYYTDWNKSYGHKHGGQKLSRLTLDCQREVYQRDSIINALLLFADCRDIIVCSDLDEIPNPSIFQDLLFHLEENQLIHLCQKWFIYYLNNYCALEWFGTRICRMQYLEKNSIDLIRYSTENRYCQLGKIIESAGWHFSFLGGADKVKEKLDSFAYKGNKSTWIFHYFDKVFKNRIKKRIENNEDIFMTGRKFYPIGIDYTFPEYLLENQEKYSHLIKE